MKTGTMIEVRGADTAFRDTWEPARIVRREPMTHYADGSDYPGWYAIRYADGARCICHESGFRVVDNR